MHPAELLLGAVAAVAVWFGRARLFPWRRCPRCKGTRRVQGMGGFRICTRCDKEGKVRRFGAGGGN